MIWIEYDYVCNADKGIILHKKVEYNEENLEIAKAEACDGEYTITDDGMPAPTPNDGGAFKVGDVLTTVRTDLDDKWALANGATIDLKSGKYSVDGIEKLRLALDDSQIYNTTGSEFDSPLDGISIASDDLLVSFGTKTVYYWRDLSSADSKTIATTVVYNHGLSIGPIYHGAHYNGVWVIVGQYDAEGGKPNIIISDDPTDRYSWRTKVLDNVDHNLYSVECYDGLWVISGSEGRLYTATDPFGEWTKIETNIATSIFCTYFHDGMWLLGSIGCKIFISNNLSGPWRTENVYNAENYKITSVEYFSDISLWVACIEASAPGSSLLASTTELLTGSTWPNRCAPQTTSGSSFAGSARLFIRRIAQKTSSSDPTPVYYWILTRAGGNERISYSEKNHVDPASTAKLWNCSTSREVYPPSHHYQNPVVMFQNRMVYFETDSTGNNYAIGVYRDYSTPNSVLVSRKFSGRFVQSFKTHQAIQVGSKIALVGCGFDYSTSSSYDGIEVPVINVYDPETHTIEYTAVITGIHHALSLTTSGSNGIGDMYLACGDDCCILSFSGYDSSSKYHACCLVADNILSTWAPIKLSDKDGTFANYAGAYYDGTWVVLGGSGSEAPRVYVSTKPSLGWWEVVIDTGSATPNSISVHDGVWIANFSNRKVYVCTSDPSSALSWNLLTLPDTMSSRHIIEWRDGYWWAYGRSANTIWYAVDPTGEWKEFSVNTTEEDVSGWLQTNVVFWKEKFWIARYRYASLEDLVIYCTDDLESPWQVYCRKKCSSTLYIGTGQQRSRMFVMDDTLIIPCGSVQSSSTYSDLKHYHRVVRLDRLKLPVISHDNAYTYIKVKE